MAAPPSGGGPLLGNMLALDAGNPASYPGSGSSWSDLSGNGNTVTLYNSPTYSATNGGSLTFNGSDQYGQAANSASLGVSGVNFTCEYWVKADTIGDYIAIAKAPWTAGPSNQNGNYMLWFSDNYDLFFTSASVGPNNANARNAVFTMNTAWHQVVYQYAAGVGTFYYDGVALTTTGANDGYSLFTTTKPLLIGKREDGFGYLNGKLSVINMWDYALTPTQIADNYDYYSTRY